VEETYLFAAVDELIAMLLREVLFGEEFLAAFELLAGLVLVLLRDAI
jgi:hypothetical protein